MNIRVCGNYILCKNRRVPVCDYSNIVLRYVLSLSRKDLQDESYELATYGIYYCTQCSVHNS